MTGAVLLAALAAALPEGTARYRAELGGEPLGFAELRVTCAAGSCSARYESRLRLPAEAGGGVGHSRVDVEVDRDGRWRGGRLVVLRSGARSSPSGVPGAVPASLLELALGAAAPAVGEDCVPFFDEHDPAPATACARREGARLAAEVDGLAEVIVPGADGFPAEVVVAERLRFVRDAAASVPARAPRLAGTRVPGPQDPRAARRFCGAPPDPPGAGPAAGLPAPRAPGSSCREKTAAYLAAARARGIEGRTAVGVAWDGGAFVWHAWAELRSGEAWIAVDPAFGELPARGPRFTLGRYGERDARARNEAGARILACWGHAHVVDR